MFKYFDWNSKIYNVNAEFCNVDAYTMKMAVIIAKKNLRGEALGKVKIAELTAGKHRCKRVSSIIPL